MSAYIVINCGYGNGPYLRATEIALAVTEQIPNDWKIVVPLLYGEKQQSIMREEFGEQDCIIFDKTFGDIIKTIVFTGTSYEEFLLHWIAHVDDASAKAAQHLQSTYGDAIAMEISRAPLLQLNIHPAYFNSFTRTSRILEESIGNDAIAIADSILHTAAKKMRELENEYDAHFISVPGTFDPQKDDEQIPPTTREKKWNEPIEPGVYVTTSGIPNVASLQEITKAFELPVYTNTPEKIPDALYLPPDALASPDIVVHIARAGWGAIWSSLLSETPLITPPYQPTDDPEIYFNNKRIEELGIGMVWKNQKKEEILHLRKTLKTYKADLRKQYAHLDGAKKAAEKIATLLV